MNDFLTGERQSLILERLRASGKVHASDLAAIFSVSEDTIRRDLRALAARGLCERVYGGALPISSASGNLATRQEQNVQEKQKLGYRIAAEIKRDMTVFLDASSTNLAAARVLPDLTCTIITNAPAIAAAFDGKSAATIIMIGGIIDRTVGGAVGAQAVSELVHYRTDLCVLGACGVDPNAGLTCFSHEDAVFKRAAADNAKQVITSVTPQKLRTCASCLVLPMTALSGLVVNETPDDDFVVTLTDHGIRLLHSDSRETPV